MMFKHNNFKHLAMLIVLVFVPGLSDAAIYKWVDESGKVHFSDSRPTTDVKVDKKVIKPSKRDVRGISSGGFSTKVAKEKSPILYKGKTDAKRIRLENVVMALDKNDGGRNIIGAYYSGGNCIKRLKTLTWSKGRIEVEAKKYQSQFNKVITEFGYQSEGAGRLFGAQQIDKAELILAAEIKELQVNSCSNQFRLSSNKKQVNTYMKIKWSVFDILERKIVHEVTTEGSSRGFYDRNVRDEESISRFKAFKTAVRNMLSDQDLVALLSPDTIISHKLASYQNLNGASLSLGIEYGKGNNKFTSVVDKLKRASVTVRSTSGHGSGFLITDDGYVITNAHVVANAKQVVILFDKIELRADLIRKDLKRDVALLKIKKFNAEALSLSTRKPVEGETVYVIGTPLDEKLSHTVTRGIISAKRTLEDGNNYLQTDAAINPGNSGGPIFNEYGEVIGIAVSGLFNRAGGSLNINFLIPINEVIESLNIVRE